MIQIAKNILPQIKTKQSRDLECFREDKTVEKWREKDSKGGGLKNRSNYSEYKEKQGRGKGAGGKIHKKAAQFSFEDRLFIAPSVVVL